MYAIITDGSISKYINHPKPLVIGDVQYPARIFSAWTASELAAIGIIEITFDNSNKKDEKWYINTNQSFTYDASAGTVTAAYGSATAKSMTDVLFTAEDEAAIPSQVEGTIKTPGLKTQMKSDVNNIAGGHLSKYDWYILRAASGGTAIPSSISTYQAAVRTKANTHCTAIDNASDVDALAALVFDWPAQP